MKSFLPILTLFFGLAVLQVTAVDRFAVYGIKPDLPLIALYAVAITSGEGMGILYGASCGFILDCMSGGYKGLFLSGYALIGYLAARAGKRVFNIGESANLSGIFVLSLVQGVYTTLLMNTFVEGYDYLESLWRLVLPQAVMNACVGALVLWLFKNQVAKRVPWLKNRRPLQVRLQVRP